MRQCRGKKLPKKNPKEKQQDQKIGDSPFLQILNRNKKQQKQDDGVTEKKGCRKNVHSQIPLVVYYLP